MDDAARATDIDKAMTRFEALASRLVAKMRLSQTPVPGFLVGLSGTDSIATFELLHRASTELGIADRLTGIHYADGRRRRETWFEAAAIPWMRNRYPDATVLVEEPLGGNHDPQRWADLKLRALNEVVPTGDGRADVRALPEGRNLWLSGCTNLTEQELGTYSLASREVSIQPIRTVRKTMVLQVCEGIGAPAIALENARLPDCFCGRDELAAAHIEVIDAILSGDIVVSEHDPALLDVLHAFIRDTKRANAFKNRVPYLV